MGIKRLYNYLRYAFEDKQLSDLNGKRVGIDAMGWLYQAYFCQCDLEAEVRLGIVRNMERKISLLQKNKIDFIFVIDGLNLPCKDKTMKKRDQKRQKFLEKSVKMEKDNYDIGESAVFKKYSESISKEIIYFFIDYLRYKELDFIVAPFEADSQLNYLYKINKIDYIMSEDSDIAGIGCKHIVKNVLKNGKCKLINDSILKSFKKSLKSKSNDQNHAKMKKADQFFKLSNEDKILLSIYSGCDYLENIKGIGFGTLVDYFPDKTTMLKNKIEKCIERDMNYGILPEDIQDSIEYFEKVSLVRESFVNQIVYCPKENKFISLGNGTSKKEKKFLDYTGDKKIFNDIDPKDFSQGLYDLETLTKRTLKAYNYDTTIKFIKKKSDVTHGLLNNLSTRTFSFANFTKENNNNDLKKRKNLDHSIQSSDSKKKHKKNTSY